MFHIAIRLVVATTALLAFGQRAPSLGATPEDCVFRKLRVIAKEAKRRIDCEARAIRDGSDPVACAARAAAIRAKRFAEIEHRSPCSSSGDSNAVHDEMERAIPALTRIVGAACGDGVRGGSEVCDGDDDEACPGVCTDSCGCPVCGDGIVDEGEACDPGLNGTAPSDSSEDPYFWDQCRSNCQWSQETCADPGMLCWFKPDFTFFTSIACCEGFACDTTVNLGPQGEYRCRPECETQADCEGISTCRDGICSPFLLCDSDEDCFGLFPCTPAGFCLLPLGE